MAKTGGAVAFVALFRALRGSLRPGEPGLGECLRAVPRLVSATLRGQYRGTSRGQLATLLLGALYVLSPVDLLPEVLLPFVGLLDDAVVLAWVAGRLVVETGQFLRWERGQRPTDLPSSTTLRLRPTVHR